MNKMCDGLVRFYQDLTDRAAEISPDNPDVLRSAELLSRVRRDTRTTLIKLEQHEDALRRIVNQNGGDTVNEVYHGDGPEVVEVARFVEVVCSQCQHPAYCDGRENCPGPEGCISQIKTPGRSQAQTLTPETV